LQKIVKYPDLARRAGVEGTVYVKVLIGKDGKPKKTLIEHSDNELLNKAAQEAVMKYRGFTPGIQNGNPIQMWISIPIEFRLN
jgi:protein TonB